jgi:hypothetical protein
MEINFARSKFCSSEVAWTVVEGHDAQRGLGVLGAHHPPKSTHVKTHRTNSSREQDRHPVLGDGKAVGAGGEPTIHVHLHLGVIYPPRRCNK